MRTFPILIKSFVCAVVLLSAASFSCAQSDRGSIAGTVVDSTGAAVSNAQVVAKGVDTSTEYPATTGTTGPGTNSDSASSGIFESKISGGQNFGTEVLLDGASTTRADSGSAFDQNSPSVEAISEFKVTTSTVTAAYGRTSGGVQSFS